MPRCFPSEPEFAEERRAERTVWEALRDSLPPEAALFHSVGLIDGDREQEIDLLVAWPGLTAVPAGFAAADLPRELVLDKDDLGSCADLVRKAIEKHGAGHRPLDEQGLLAVIGLLVGELFGQTEVRLPRELGELAARRPPAERFDSVVVDEGQDFGQLWWPSLLACLRDPDQGGLFVFLDEAQRVFSRDGVVPIDLPPYLLNENIRNTKRIAREMLYVGLSRARSLLVVVGERSLLETVGGDGVRSRLTKAQSWTPTTTA